MSAAAPSVLSLRPLSLLIGALLASTAQAAAPAREDARTLDRLEVRERAPGAYAPLPLEAARLRIEERAGGVGIVDAVAVMPGRRLRSALSTARPTAAAA